METQTIETENKDFYLFNDRNDKEYLKVVADLLSFDKLKKHAIPDNKGFQTVMIKFCGLSAMSLLGGTDNRKNNPAYKAFINLLSNKGDIISELNKAQIKVQIKLLFAYPYSDFYYDLLQAEKTDFDEISINCIIGRIPFNHSLNSVKTVKYEDIISSATYKNLKQSLKTLYKYQNEIFNNDLNSISIKLAPISVLSCILQINNTVFVDPYLYAKEEPQDEKLSLFSPITKITAIPIYHIKDEEIHKNNEQVHYYSILSNFRYLWEHPLTLYSMDAIDKETDSLIIPPHLISYKNKADRLVEKLNEKGKLLKTGDIEGWKQKTIREFSKHVSKFNHRTVPNSTSIKLFIVGAWEKNKVGAYMTCFQTWIINNFSDITLGLKVEPIVIKVENGKEVQRSIYDGLNISDLACIIQTADISHEKPDKSIEYYSRPNVYLEKGFLMSRLGKHKDYQDNLKEKVFVLRESSVHIESDNNNYAHTVFLNMDNFELQFHKIIFWLWELTELNSTRTISLLETFKEDLAKKKNNLNQHGLTLEDINEAEEEIENNLLNIHEYLNWSKKTSHRKLA